MKVHELKTWPAYYESILKKEKNFEIRKNDRDFKVGDILRLREYDPIEKQYLGRYMDVEVTYMLYGHFNGLHPEYCCMSIK